jgi:hypothetical protein
MRSLEKKESIWNRVRQQFIQGIVIEDGSIHYPTIAELREVHGIPYTTIRRRMIDEGWIEKRDKYKCSLDKWLHAATADEYIEAATKFNGLCIEASQRAVEQIREHLHTRIADGETVSPLDLDRLGRSMVSWQKVGRLALGLSTENNFMRSDDNQRNIDGRTPIDVSLLSEQEQLILESFIIKVENTTEEEEM